MTSELWKLGVCEARSQFRSGILKPSQVLESILDRVKVVDPIVNAFAFLDTEGARSAAAESDKRWQRRAPLSDVDGTVISVKDNIPVKGLPCMWGTEVYRDYVPEADELAVERLRVAGAIIIGKTNVSEFSAGRGIVSTPVFGTTRNPWNTSRTTGSSSGGAAAAVATGMGAAAIGTDGGGSIRTPASHCGLVGFKPTAGRIPRVNGLPIILAGLEAIGILSRSIEDSVALFNVLNGPDARDGGSWAIQKTVIEPQTMPGGLKILYMTAAGSCPVQDHVRDACDRVANRLRAAGHHVEEGPAPFDVDVQLGTAAIFPGGLAWLLKDKDWRGKIGDFYVRRYESGSALSAVAYIDALAAARKIQAQIGVFFESWDMLLSPVLGDVAGAADQEASFDYRAFTAFANSAGVPAIALPGGLSPDGMPIGFQLVAPFAAEGRLFALARAYQASYSWLDQRPPL